MTRIYFIIGGVLLSLMALGGLVYATVSKVEGMTSEAARLGRAERDLYWRGQIEQMKSAAEKQIADNLRQTMAAQNAARDQVAEAEARAAELEKANAALPNAAGRGISRDRVRLLNRR